MRTGMQSTKIVTSSGYWHRSTIRLVVNTPNSLQRTLRTLPETFKTGADSSARRERFRH